MSNSSSMAADRLYEQATPQKHRWVKLYPKAEQSQVFSDPNLWHLFTWCLMRANWKSGWFERIEIQPGQFVINKPDACSIFGISASTLNRRLDRLVELGCIEVKANTRFTVIHICGWNQYQQDEPSKSKGAENGNAKENVDETHISSQVAENERKTDDITGGKRMTKRAVTIEEVLEVLEEEEEEELEEPARASDTLLYHANSGHASENPTGSAVTPSSQQSGTGVSKERQPSLDGIRQPEVQSVIDQMAGIVWPTKDGGTWQPDEVMLMAWIEAYPQVDIPMECRKSVAWCKSNESKRKTAHGMGRHVNDWLSRAPVAATSVKPTNQPSQAALAAAARFKMNRERPLINLELVNRNK